MKIKVIYTYMKTSTIVNAFLEFTHKLLDWLEEAFKIRDMTSSNSAKEDEAMEADTEKCDKESFIHELAM